MKVVRDFSRNVDLPPVALAIGKFDGVHLGHQALLGRIKHAASRLGIDAAVMTFSPHPRDFFANRKCPHGYLAQSGPRVSNLRDTLGSLADAGVNRIIYQRFDEAFSRMTADAFIRNVLVKALHLRWLTVGFDFRFGADCEGDVEMLTRAGRFYGFHVEAVPLLNAEGEEISSSRVRSALQRTDLESARRMLGRAFIISGRLSNKPIFCSLLNGRHKEFHGASQTPLPSGAFSIRLYGTAGSPVGGTIEVMRYRHGTPFPGARVGVELATPIATDPHQIVRIEILAPLASGSSDDAKKTASSTGPSSWPSASRQQRAIAC